MFAYLLQESSIGTIKTKANVCCIQFPPDSGHLLTFGSADYKIYCYDLRTTRQPLCILASHNKAVSYVKFVDPTTLVSASTDNTLKLWDLKRANMTPNALTMCSLTYTGHTNEKVWHRSQILVGHHLIGSGFFKDYSIHMKNLASNLLLILNAKSCCYSHYMFAAFFCCRISLDYPLQMGILLVVQRQMQ